MNKSLRTLLFVLGGLLAAYGFYLLFWSLVFGARFDSLAVAAEARAKQPKYIIDADTANEVDDLFAIVGAMARDNRYNYDEPLLVGLTSAQFHSSPLASDTTARESHAINQRLVELMYAPVPVYLGSDLPLTNHTTPQISPASNFIAEQARTANTEQKLDVFILGSCTNVASAILQDASIIPKLHVHYLGFWYDPLTSLYDKNEFNTGNDTLALNLLLNTPNLAFTVMTATTSQALQMQRSDLDTKLLQDSPVTQFLKDRWDTYHRWWTEKDPEKRQWTMWDIASLEAWFEPQLATLESRPAPADNVARNIQVYTAIDSAAMLENYFAVVDSSLRFFQEAIK
ncbi:MAG: nucleoside hydrolase [Bacteroidota bacterium]